jgi:hypothetical protein|tara:strand:+ start:312 stop:440 length:129 start_codon:yes stop_codon:yes gene_type:complete
LHILLHLGEELRTLRLEELTVGVVVLERNTILLHNIVVKELS